MLEKLEILRGDDLGLRLELEDDITGAKIYFTAKKNFTDTDEFAVLKAETSAHLDAANGISYIEIPAAHTGAVEPGTYQYDIQIKYADGAIESWGPETLYVKADVTERTN